MVRIVFFGTPDFAVPSLDRLLERSEFEVLGVVTQPDKRRGRGSAVSFSPVKERAVQQNLPLWQPQRIKKDPETLQALAALEADIFAVVAYGQLLSPELLAMPRLGCVNVHWSQLLPRYRGAAPIQWSLYHGDGETGITTMLMDVGMDTGDMLLKSTTPIGLLDTAESLGHRLAQQGAGLLVETLMRWSDLRPEPQDPSQATLAPLIQKEDYILRWKRSALALHNQIRGFYPHSQTQFRGKLLKVSASIPLGVPLPEPLPEPWWAVARHWVEQWVEQWVERPEKSLKLLSGQATIPPGTVVDVIKHYGPVIQTGEGYLLLTQVQPAGKRSLSGWDFVNGARMGVGDCLEN